MRGLTVRPNDNLVGISRNFCFIDESDFGFILLRTNLFFDAGERVKTRHMRNLPNARQLTADHSRKPIVGSNDFEVALIDRGIVEHGSGEFGKKGRKLLFSLFQFTDWHMHQLEVATVVNVSDT